MHLKALVKNILHRNEQSGFTVIEVGTTSSVFPVIVVGEFSEPPTPGEVLHLNGEFREHKVYGRRFVAKNYTVSLPQKREGAELFLARFVKGIGRSTARLLYDTFGSQIFDIIEHKPERLLEIPGVGRKKQKMIVDGWRQERRKGKARQETISSLLALGLTPSRATKLWKRYGDSAVRIIRTDPYSLIGELPQWGFATADKIALANKIAPNATVRLDGALRAVLNAALSDGHTYIVEQELIRRAAELLSLKDVSLSQRLDAIVNGGKLLRVGEDGIALRWIYDEESFCARHLSLLSASRIRKVSEGRLSALIDRIERNENIEYSDAQRKAISGVFRHPVSVITGGPGTGKTTIVRAIVSTASALGYKIALCAPTGRAAQRMSERAAMPAQTIHRLLDYRPFSGFTRGESASLMVDMVIVDESSMMDIFLFASLLRALAHGTQLVLIGDADQLPSVGAGAVLSDIIHSRAIPVFRLWDIVRQKEASGIIKVAHSIIRGEVPRFSNAENDDIFFIAENNPNKLRDTIVELVVERLPHFLSCSPNDIQVITPMHRGPVGTDELNSALRRRLNPDAGDENSLRVGDRIMQIENNYELDLFNGDWGEIIGEEPGGFIVRMSGRELLYPREYIGQLTLSYAITVHKSQGSEYPVVVIPLVMGHYVMLKRRLLYTAVTRARRAVVLAGEKRAFEYAVQNAGDIIRWTMLGKLLSGQLTHSPPCARTL